MVNPNPTFLSKRVKKKDQSGITSDRYQFLGLDQAEPDLGDPLVGPSSIGANPYTGAIEDVYILVADTSGSGKRYWTKQTSVIAGGVVSPGSITVRNKGQIVGSVNQITDLNFVGSGVTVVNPATWVGAGSSSVDISVTVTDVALPSGPTGALAYKDSSGLLQGSTQVIFNPVTGRVGIGTTTPTEKLNVIGNIRASGNIFAENITSKTFTVDNFKINETTVIFSVTEDSVGIGTTIPISTLDVRGNTNILGIATISRVATQNIQVSSAATFGSVSIGSTQVISQSRQLQNITSLDNITTATIEDAIRNAPNTFTDLEVVGVSTLNTLGVLGLTTTRDLLVSGVTTTQTLNVNSSITTQNLNSVGISSITNLRVTNLQSSGISTFSSLTVTGLAEVEDLLVIDSATIDSANITNVSISSSIGVGTDNALYDLDVNGDVRVTGRFLVNNGSGTSGQVLISDGINPPNWGSPSEVTAGSATSVTTIDTNDNAIYYPTFVSKTEGNQTLNLDKNGLSYNPFNNRLGIGTTSPSANLSVTGNVFISGNTTLSGITTVLGDLDINIDGLTYNPSTNRLGIGSTNPQSTLAVGGTITELYAGQFWNVVTQADVGYGASQVPLNQFLGQLAFLDEYLPPQFRNTEVVTSTTDNVILDSLDADFERSARYNIQITCNGQLVGSGISASSKSVTNLNQGQNYVSGQYNNVLLTATSGTGNDARANLTITPEATLTLNAIQGGLFAFQESVTGLSTNKPIYFDRAIPASAAENSRVTSITVTNTGLGYTSVPNVAIATPTNSPSISGVTGIGSTATAEASTMVVTDFTLTSSGIHTNIPTVTFLGPVGVGTTAAGIVGFGVSTIESTSSGSNYSYIPTVSIPGSSGGVSATAGITSVFVTNIRVSNGGFGYTGTSGGSNYPILTIQPPNIGTVAVASVTSLSLSDYFTVSPGVGYTRPPSLTVGSPTGTGVTATIASTLGISTFIVVSSGAGYTVSPTLSISPTPTAFSAVVGMGVSQDNLQFSGGSGYSPDVYDIQFIPVGGIGTGAQATVSFNVGGFLENFTITNPGYGYTVPPTVVITGGSPANVAIATITTLFFTDIEVKNIGFGLTSVPSVFLSPVGGLGDGAQTLPSMGIGTVFVTEYGSGYTSNPSIAVTAIDGITGGGASVISSGLGVRAANIAVVNTGIGYTFIPTVTFSSPIGTGITAIGSCGVGISQISVTNPGNRYFSSLPSVVFSGEGEGSTGSGANARVSSIITTNISITNSGAGYTQFDLEQTGIATFSPEGTSGIVGFGVSTIRITSLGIGYTTPQSAAVTVSAPLSGLGVTATASSNLGFPGILPGPGYDGTSTKIYYIAEVTGTNTLKLSISPGIGTLTQTDVANTGFSENNPRSFAGGRVSTVSIVYPGSGYTKNSVVSINNTFDGGNVGTGFSFIAAPVNNFQVSDVMLLQSNGSDNPRADFIEYSSLANDEILGSFSATMISGSNPSYSANLVFTPTYRNNTIKISRNKFNV